MYMRLLAVALVIVLGLIGWRFYIGYTAYDTLVEAPHHQYVGSDNPSLIITAIMDYRCPHCRAMHDNMTAFVALNPDIQVIYRVFPVFQEPSIREAKIAMAAGMQGKFEAMHNKLIRREDPITPDELDTLIDELGLDRQKFQKDMVSWGVTKDLLDSSAAVRSLNITATPTLIIGREILPLKKGVPTVEDLNALVEKHRASSTPKASL